VYAVGNFAEIYSGAGMNKNIESFILTRRELQIMKMIWANKSATVKEVHAALTKIKPISRNTILTLTRILEHKGALAHRRSGRAYIYEPLLSYKQATQNHIRDMIARFFDGAPEKLIENLIQNEIKTPEQLGSAKSLVELKSEDVLATAMTAPESSNMSKAANQ
jgi:BlaI family transcriptional regulator, penicillinase repressor